MARFYGNKILSSAMSLEDVPKLWRAATQDWLDKNGTSSGLS